MRAPGPTTPALLQLAQYMRDPLGVIEACGKKYGDVFSLKLSRQGWVFLSNPADVRELFTEGRDTYAAGAAKRSVFGSIVGDGSSLLLDGAAHRRRRKLLVPQFRGDNLRAQSELLRDLCTTATEEWLRRGDIKLHDELHKLVRTAILHAIFGPPGSGASPALIPAIEEFSDKVAGSKLLLFPRLQVDLGAWSPWGRVTRVLERTDRELYAEIRRRRSHPSPNDLLGSLMAATDDDAQTLSDSDLRDEALTLVVAGHEITSSVLSWLFYAIVSRPAVLSAVRRELADKLGDGELDARKVDELAYLDAVMRESMRFYSTIPNGSARIALAPTRIRDFEIPEGALVTVAMHLLHRRPEIFDAPDQFLPERFLRGKFGPHQYAPFGGGERRCLGSAIATHELKMIVATVLRRVEMRSVLPAVRAVRRGAFVAPQGGLRVEITPLRATSA